MELRHLRYSHLYEAKIKSMGNAGRNGGEYYTPRPLIRAIVQKPANESGHSSYGAADINCDAVGIG